MYKCNHTTYTETFPYPAMTHVRLASVSLSIQSFIRPSSFQASVLYSSFTHISSRINVILMLHNRESYSVLLLGFECSHLGQMRTERSWPHTHICDFSLSLSFLLESRDLRPRNGWFWDVPRGMSVCVRERLVDWALASCQNHTQTIPH